MLSECVTERLIGRAATPCRAGNGVCVFVYFKVSSENTYELINIFVTRWQCFIILYYFDEKGSDSV